MSAFVSSSGNDFSAARPVWTEAGGPLSGGIHWLFRREYGKISANGPPARNEEGSN